MMCRVLDVSESGYYRHCSHVSVKSRINDTALLTHIRAMHAEVKGEYSWPRMWKALQAKGIKVSKERVRQMMKQNGIQARGKRKFVVTTDSKHHLPIGLIYCNVTLQRVRQIKYGRATLLIFKPTKAGTTLR